MHPDEKAIRELIATWLDASRRHDVDTVLRLMADDVVFLQPGHEPMRGRATFAKMQRQLAAASIDARSDVQEVKVFGDWAYCWNHLTVTITAKPGAEPVTRSGPVLSVLHKRDGNWVIVRDANMLAAPAPS